VTNIKPIHKIEPHLVPKYQNGVEKYDCFGCSDWNDDSVR